jgi:hypothetical protein
MYLNCLFEINLQFVYSLNLEAPIEGICGYDIHPIPHVFLAFSFSKQMALFRSDQTNEKFLNKKNTRICMNIFF